MARKKINYSEGDCVVVPLCDENLDHSDGAHGYVRCVIARMDGKGSLLVYFFGPKIDNLSDIKIDGTLRADQSIKVLMCGDLGLLEGEWNVLGRLDSYSRKDWPMPKFLHLDCINDEPYLRTYDEDTLAWIDEEKIANSDINIEKHPKDGLSGYVAAEIHVTKAILET